MDCPARLRKTFLRATSSFRRKKSRKSLQVWCLCRNPGRDTGRIQITAGAMKNFTYSRAGTAQEALSLVSTLKNAKFLGGGTNLVDLMRENIEHPDAVIDVTRLASGIREAADGGVAIGAEVKNSAVANHPLIRQRYPMLSQAILSGASGQIRNMATVGGNIMQRTRCYYFYDESANCNKRTPNAGCDAINGFNRIHAILGASESCIAPHPSDMCVALAALDASVRVVGPRGARVIPFNAFHLLPGDSAS
jgi:xanthine dehydrogenase YagS FAD-binding subunit